MDKLLINKVFNIKSDNEFNKLSLEIFKFQAKNNEIYAKYLDFLNINIEKIEKIQQIPFLPIEFFKSKKIITKYSHLTNDKFTMFKSSGTTGIIKSRHFVFDIKLYEKSFLTSFKHFFGEPTDYIILALLPSYLEAGNSSLVYMVDKLIKLTNNSQSGFFLNNIGELANKIRLLEKNNEKIIIFGVTYALLELVKKHNFNSKNTIIIETGGMKGKGKELTREELHEKLKIGFGTDKIYSEYGMTELLSQAYFLENKIFTPSSTMKVLIRDINDPFCYLEDGKTGGINIIDLSNIYSCSFIETKDLGNKKNNQFNVIGRFDNSDIRGCNLLTN